MVIQSKLYNKKYQQNFEFYFFNSLKYTMVATIWSMQLNNRLTEWRNFYLSIYVPCERVHLLDKVVTYIE